MKKYEVKGGIRVYNEFTDSKRFNGVAEGNVYGEAEAVAGDGERVYVFVRRDEFGTEMVYAKESLYDAWQGYSKNPEFCGDEVYDEIERITNEAGVEKTEELREIMKEVYLRVSTAWDLTMG